MTWKWTKLDSACGRRQVGDQIVEINGEATQGITHTRAIELIQAGGHKVHLLLRPGQGLVPDHSESTAQGLGGRALGLPITRRDAAIVWMRLLAERSTPWFPCMRLLILLLLCQLPALIFRFGTAAYSYLFIFSSYRSELFFHPVLLHETRASLKASLLFSVCPLITLVNLVVLSSYSSLTHPGVYKCRASSPPPCPWLIW